MTSCDLLFLPMKRGAHHNIAIILCAGGSSPIGTQCASSDTKLDEFQIAAPCYKRNTGGSAARPYHGPNLNSPNSYSTRVTVPPTCQFRKASASVAARCRRTDCAALLRAAASHAAQNPHAFSSLPTKSSTAPEKLSFESPATMWRASATSI